ncbi:8988_t:CDS:1, partial [Racocetra persica]
MTYQNRADCFYGLGFKPFAKTNPSFAERQVIFILFMTSDVLKGRYNSSQIKFENNLTTSFQYIIIQAVIERCVLEI